MSITRRLAHKFTNYNHKKSLGTILREKRARNLIEMIDSIYNKNGFVNIIDIWGTIQYWNIISKQFLDKRRVQITIVNLFPIKDENNGPFQFATADGCHLKNFKDKSFHIGHSNSVVEHVGDWSRMVAFAKELSRVSEKLFVQTPNYWFPVEPHCMVPFFHWLPKPIRIRLVSRFQLGHWKRAESIDEAVRIVESARLLKKNMMQALFEDSEILTEKFLGLPKSFVAVKK